MYVVNFDNHKSTETQWLALYVNDNTTTYFDRFRVEGIPEEMKTFIEKKNI